MLEGRELIRATLPFIREQRFWSWWHLVTTGGVYAGCLAVGAMPLPWYVRLTAAILGGLVMCRMFILFHDQQHGAIFRGSRVVNWFMTSFGMLTLNPPTTWNQSHNYHHKHNSKIRSASIGSFPIMTVEAYRRASWRERYKYAAARHPLTIMFAWVTVFLIGMTLVSLIRKPRQHLDCAVAVALHVALWVTLAIFAPWALLYSFVIPFFIGSSLGAYLFYVQHNFPDVDLGEQSEWDYVFAALKASSFLDTNRVMHWFTGNIGYHHIHHLNARIPFYRLPEAMRALSELQEPGRTTLSPLAIYRSFKLKLWDGKKRRMVGFREAWQAAPAPTEMVGAMGGS